MEYEEIDKLLARKSKYELFELVKDKADKVDLEDFITELYTKKELEEILGD